MRRIKFIINPISGKGNSDHLLPVIKSASKRFGFEYNYVFTKKPEQATTITKTAVKDKFDAVVSVGGDGTLNEIMKALIGSDTKLGIIPRGSGNGMARHLNIPLDPESALAIIANFKSKKIDTSTLNNLPFVMMAGIGFDADIAWQFAQSDKRGLTTYAKLAVQNFTTYSPKEYRFQVDGKTYKRKALLISFANGSQYGNNFTISPEAKEDDGLIDVCILSKFPVITAPIVSLQMLTNTINNSPYLEIIQGKEITILDRIDRINLDGEAIEINDSLHIKVNPLTLNIIIP